MGTSVNPVLTQDEQIFKDLIWTPMVSAGEIWLQAAVPILSTPGVKQIDDAVIQAATDALFNQIILLVDVKTIQFIDTAYQTAYDNASLQLKIIAEEKGTGSSEYQSALSVALAAMSRFTDINTG